MFGTVAELAAKATWADRDIYVSGPDEMIVRTVQMLRERGAPGHLIRYDLGGQADLRRLAGTARYPEAEAVVTSGTAGTCSDLAPAGGPRPVGHRVVPEQGRCLGIIKRNPYPAYE